MARLGSHASPLARLGGVGTMIRNSTKILRCGGRGAAWLLMEKGRAGMPGRWRPQMSVIASSRSSPDIDCLARASCSVVTPFEVAPCLPSVQNILFPQTAPR